MDAQGWLKCKDPTSMRRRIWPRHHCGESGEIIGTERQARLYCAAAIHHAAKTFPLNERARASLAEVERYADAALRVWNGSVVTKIAEPEDYLIGNRAAQVATLISQGDAAQTVIDSLIGHVEAGILADLMRDILGENPFVPYRLPGDPICPRCHGNGKEEWGTYDDEYDRRVADGEPTEGSTPCLTCAGSGRVLSRQEISTWNGGVIPALAREAYNNRDRKCVTCDGARYARDHRAGEVRGAACQECRDEGTVNDGSIDPERLGILADALEDAGCINDDIMFPLRGVIGCARCDGSGYYYTSPALASRTRCERCYGTGLENPPPRYRGWWVLDLFLEIPK